MPVGTLNNDLNLNSFPPQADIDLFVKTLCVDIAEIYLNPNPLLKTKVDFRKTSNLSDLDKADGTKALLTFIWNTQGNNRMNQTTKSVSQSWQLDYQFYFTMLSYPTNSRIFVEGYQSFIKAMTNNRNLNQNYVATVQGGRAYGCNLQLNELNEGGLVVRNEPENTAQPNYMTATFNIILKVYKV